MGHPQGEIPGVPHVPLILVLRNEAHSPSALRAVTPLLDPNFDHCPNLWVWDLKVLLHGASLYPSSLGEKSFGLGSPFLASITDALVFISMGS